MMPESGRPRSLGFRTDLMVLGLQGSVIERRDGYRVIRSPRNPDYHWGNYLLLDGPPAAGSIGDWIDLFRDEFPGARHLCFGVDGTDGVTGDPAELVSAELVSAEFASAELEVERITVLAATVLRPSTRPAPIAELRMLEPGDWTDAAELDIITNPSDAADFRPFIAAQFASFREVQESGGGGWFGAFVDGRMVSGLGLFDDGDGVARYHSVVTHPDFRGRGLAGALVAFAGRFAVNHRGVATLVIAADPEYHAIRIYRSLGFEAVETQVKIEREPSD